jgi:trans-aconitate methyltransferase
MIAMVPSPSAVKRNPRPPHVLLRRVAVRDNGLQAPTMAMRAAYPRRDGGLTLFPFRRLFIVARR